MIPVMQKLAGDNKKAVDDWQLKQLQKAAYQAGGLSSQ
jgi:hypothetical protein